MVRRPSQLAQRVRSRSVAHARTTFHQRPLTWIAGGAGAVLLGVSGIFGGLERRPVAATPAVDVGVPVEAAPWTVSIERAVTFDELEGVYLTEEASHWLVVVATVTVTDDEPVSKTAIGRAVQPIGVDGLRRDDRGMPVDPLVLIVSDGADLTTLNPGVAEQVAFLWEQGDEAEANASVVMRVVAATYRRDAFSGLPRWMYDETTPVASVELEVEAR